MSRYCSECRSWLTKPIRPVRISRAKIRFIKGLAFPVDLPSRVVTEFPCPGCGEATWTKKQARRIYGFRNLD
jgi:hypothetical protein